MSDLFLSDLNELTSPLGTDLMHVRRNSDTDDPATAAKIGVRFPVVDRIARSLERNYLKEVEVTYL